MPFIKKKRLVKFSNPNGEKCTEYMFVSLNKLLKNKSNYKIKLQGVNYYYKNTSDCPLNKIKKKYMSREDIVDYISTKYKLDKSQFKVIDLFNIPKLYNAFIIVINEQIKNMQRYSMLVPFTLDNNKNEFDIFQRILVYPIQSNKVLKSDNDYNGVTSIKINKLYKALIGYY